MTTKEFNQLPWKAHVHLSMENEHTMSYIADIGIITLGMCVHTPYVDGAPAKGMYTHYMVNGKVYITKRGALAAINRILSKFSANCDKTK